MVDSEVPDAIASPGSARQSPATVSRKVNRIGISSLMKRGLAQPPPLRPRPTNAPLRPRLAHAALAVSLVTVGRRAPPFPAASYQAVLLTSARRCVGARAAPAPCPNAGRAGEGIRGGTAPEEEEH